MLLLNSRLLMCLGSSTKVGDLDGLLGFGLTLLGRCEHLNLGCYHRWWLNPFLFLPFCLFVLAIYSLFFLLSINICRNFSFSVSYFNSHLYSILKSLQMEPNLGDRALSPSAVSREGFVISSRFNQGDEIGRVSI